MTEESSVRPGPEQASADRTSPRLDTTGEVFVSVRPLTIWGGRRCTWTDLDPFTQGYIEALFGSFDHPGYLDVEPGNSDAGHVPVGFRHLAPETLARIIEDCAKGVDLTISPMGRMYNPNSSGGLLFLGDRQAGALADVGFPPLTVTLADDGKVYVSEFGGSSPSSSDARPTSGRAPK